jgi:hypothetical protein
MRKLITMLVVLALVVCSGVLGAMAAGSAVTVTNSGAYTEIYNVTFSADTDTAYSLAHTLGVAPDEYHLTAIDANCLAVNAGFGLGNIGMPWVNESAISTTAFGLSKHNVQGSATCSVRVVLRRMHSIIK